VPVDRRLFCGLLGTALASRAFGQPRRRRVALLFDSLISPFWVTALEIMRGEADRRGWSVLQAVSNMDDTKQYSQVQSMLQQGVDGILIVHTDDKAVIPAIRAANAAGVPLVHFNRAPAPSDAYSVAVVADNRRIMHETVAALLEEARRRGGRYRAALLVGDLGDANAVQRRAGFFDGVREAKDLVEVVAEIATEWNADKAFAGLSNALQAHPDINMLVSASDFLTPQIEQALRIARKWNKATEPGHVLIASFDGDANAYAELAAGYYDADGVQNLSLEVTLSFDALEQQWVGQRPPKVLIDPGLVVTARNLEQMRTQMWGYTVWKAARPAASAGPGTAGGSGSVALAPSTPVSLHATGGLGWAALLGAMLAFAHVFLSVTTLHEVLVGMLPLAILVIGQTAVLLVGQIDLSITAIMAVGSVLAAAAMTRHSMGEPLATTSGVVVCLGVGLLVGLFNGVCTTLLRMPSFIVTLAVMMLGSGAVVWYASAISDTISIGGLPHAFRVIGYGSILGVPIALLLCGVVALGAWYVLSRTLLGRWVYAVGHNTQAARISGVPVRGVIIGAFMTSGLCAGLASVIFTSRVETGLPTLGQNMLLDVIGAAVIGGVSLFGGRGNVFMALGGALFLSLLDKSLELLGLSLFLVLAIKGGAILIAAIADAHLQRRRVTA
jgi:ribose/xylose/arabinose/galactoside ABC-type transport system permease subunit/ABC-type sugar transport system substrate-binding protein